MDGAATIVAIIDGAEPLRLDLDTASEASANNVAPRQRRGRSSSSPALSASVSPSSPGLAGTAAPPSAAPPPSHPPDLPPSSHSGGSSEGGNDGGTGGEPPETPDQLNLRLAFLRQTDLGNVFRFVERNRGKLLYNETLPGTSSQGGGWLYWDGCRWAREGADARVRIAEHECVQAIGAEAKACLEEAERLARQHADIVERAPAKKKKSKDQPAGNVITVDFRAKTKKDAPASAPVDETAQARPDAAKIAERITTLYRVAASLAGWARSSEANSKMVPIARHAAAYLRVDLAELDADPLAFNVRNGTLVFRREWDAVDDPAIKGHESWQAIGDYIKFKPHNPGDRITKLAPVDFTPGAGCPKFVAFLAEVQPDAEMRRFLQEWKGYQLTGETGESRMCIFHGKGRNGKGVFEDATGWVLGDYGGSTPVKTFLIEGIAKGAGQATPELAKLPRLRSLRTSEPSKEAKLDEALIKLVTGGDPIDARHLNRPFFTFLPEFKLTMLTNHKPKISGVDEGIWARVTLVPWGVIIPEKQRDQRLARKLQAEAPGILAWMLDGLSVWLERGLTLPDQVREATATYRSDSDPLGQFLAMCTELAPGERTQATPFHELFLAWSKANAGPEWSARGLAMAMQGRGYRSVKVSVMYWLDIRLTKQPSDFIDIDGRPLVGTKPDREDGDEWIIP